MQGLHLRGRPEALFEALELMVEALSLVAKIPLLSARIFRNVFMEGKHIPSDPSMDWAGNYAQMLGVVAQIAALGLEIEPFLVGRGA